MLAAPVRWNSTTLPVPEARIRQASAGARVSEPIGDQVPALPVQDSRSVELSFTWITPLWETLGTLTRRVGLPMLVRFVPW